MENFLKSLLEYFHFLLDQPCIVTSAINDLIILGGNKVISQWVDVVSKGL